MRRVSASPLRDSRAAGEGVARHHVRAERSTLKWTNETCFGLTAAGQSRSWRRCSATSCRHTSPSAPCGTSTASRPPRRRRRWRRRRGWRGRSSYPLASDCWPPAPPAGHDCRQTDGRTVYHHGVARDIARSGVRVAVGEQI